MDINSFSNSSTPIIECTAEGKVRGMNPAAKATLRGVRKGSHLSINGRLCTFPFGRCLAAERDGRIFLLFCDFLRLDIGGSVYPTAAEALKMDAQALLDVISVFSQAAEAAPSHAALHRARALLYDRFSYIFRSESTPEKCYLCGKFLESYRTAAAKGFAGIGGRLSFHADALSARYINVRNATVLLTGICSLLLCHTPAGTVSVHAADAGEYLRVQISASPGIPMPVHGHGSQLTELLPLFPDGAADLYSAQLCLDACDGRAEYAINDGRLSISLYLQCTKELYALLDPIAEKNITSMMEKYMEHLISR